MSHAAIFTLTPRPRPFSADFAAGRAGADAPAPGVSAGRGGQRADTGRDPPRRVRPVSRQQRPAVVSPRCPCRPGPQVHLGCQHHSLPHARRRHPHPARSACGSPGGRHQLRQEALEVHARAERGVRQLPGHASSRSRLQHRVPLLRHAEAGGPVRWPRVPSGPEWRAMDHHGVRRRGRQHLVAEQGPMARRSRGNADQCRRAQRPDGRFKREVRRQHRPRRRLHPLGLARPVPDQQLQRVIERRSLRALHRQAGRPDARFLRPPREHRTRPPAVRAGGAHAARSTRNTWASTRSRRMATS